MAMLFSDYLKDNFKENKPLQTMLIIVGTTIFIGVVWEFSEYIENQTLIEPFWRWFHVHAYFMGDLQDTIKDLMNDILGALTYSVLHLLRRRNTHQVQG